MKQREEGGFAWVVVFSSFLVHFITFGIVNSSGILFRLFLADFGQNYFETSWTSAIMLSSTVLAGIPATVCIYRVGCGMTVLIGGGLATTGFALSRMATKVWQTYTTVGLMAGAGFGFAVTPAIMSVQCYFIEKREMALAIVTSGIGLGQVVFPILMDWLIHEYDREMLVTVLAGISALLCVCGLLMKPVSRQLYSLETLKIFKTTTLKNTAFGLLCLTNFLWSVGVSIMYVYLPDYVKAADVNSTLSINKEGNLTGAFDPTNIIAVSGFASFASRIIFYLLNISADLDTVSVVMCSILLSGMLTGLAPEFFKTVGGQMGYAIIFGMHTGFWGVFMSHISREVVGERRMAYGRGYLYLSISLGLCVGPPVAGSIYDLKESHEILFYLAGTCMLAGSVVMTAVNWKGAELVASDSEMSLEMQPIVCGPSTSLLAQAGNGAIIQAGGGGDDDDEGAPLASEDEPEDESTMEGELMSTSAL